MTLSRDFIFIYSNVTAFDLLCFGIGFFILHHLEPSHQQAHVGVVVVVPLSGRDDSL